MSVRRWIALAIVLAVSGHQLALEAGQLTGGSGLQAADHGALWGMAVALVTAAAVVGLFLAGWRMVALRLQLTLRPTLALPGGDALLRTWLLLTLLALAVFLAQENLEHLTQHGHLPLLEPLFSGQYEAVLPVFAGLGLLLATAGLAIGTTLRRLNAAVRATRRDRVPPPRRIGIWRTLLHDRRQLSRRLTALSPRRGPPLAACA